MRIELTTSVWKTEVLPLNYTRIIKFLIFRVSSTLKLFYHFFKSLSITFLFFLKKVISKFHFIFKTLLF